ETERTNDETTTIYRTGGGITVRRRTRTCDGAREIDARIEALNHRRGAVLTSGVEYPGRYKRSDIGFIDPPLVLEAREGRLEVRALNGRGIVLLPAIARALSESTHVSSAVLSCDRVRCEIVELEVELPEELRSRRPTVLSAVRAVRELFSSPDDQHLGLYGAFGYDLVLGFEPLRRRFERAPEQRDLVLYLPDSIAIVDHAHGLSVVHEYDFACDGSSTNGIPRHGEPDRIARRDTASVEPCDHTPADYEALVRRASESFARGELFEVVLSQTFRERTELSPSTLFRRLCEKNPAPYGFLLALGEEDYLIGASPEMFVRVEGDRVETCPIAGTTARGADALEDAQQIRKLLESSKDEWELTMCTDVDRNDKSRVCLPGSV
ncbi:MAG: chorismate-binding protein, partial [Polyangiaceae bacterium]|nr:chorismate-binding protein [Polyangiaceae bacterium]